MSQIDSLKKLQTFDANVLSREEELGANFHFKDATENAEQIINFSKELDTKTVENFPENNIKEIEQKCSAMLQYFKSITEFDNSTNNALQVRNNLINKSNSNRDAFFNLLVKYKSVMPVKYKASNDFKDYENQIKNSVKTAASSAMELKMLLQSSFKDVDDAQQQQSENLNKCDDRINILNSMLEDTETEINGTFNKVESDLKNDFSNLRTELKEALALDEARELWGSKRNSHRLNYIVLGMILAIILIVTPAIAIWNVDFIAEKIKTLSASFSNQSIPTGQEETAWVFALSNQITRLLIVGLPITAYIWATRILVRIFLSNRALMDDAYERKTMLDTYLYLVGQGNANVEDRPLILNALFRSSPGQAPDIEPPNLSDVVNLKKQAN